MLIFRGVLADAGSADSFPLINNLKSYFNTLSASDRMSVVTLSIGDYDWIIASLDGKSVRASNALVLSANSKLFEVRKWVV